MGMTGRVYELKYKNFLPQLEQFKYYEDVCNRIIWLKSKGRIKEGEYTITEKYIRNNESVTAGAEE